MTLKFYNTIEHRTQEFIPANNNKVKIYSCGPTVYNYAHIGNFRTFVANDLIRRYLKYKGYEVEHVVNITDIDDKTIKGSQSEGLALKDYTEKYTRLFFDDCASLNIEPVEHNPRATDFIPDMIQFIETLDQKGFTYNADNSVYFKISSFPLYGSLSNIDMSGMKSGLRYDTDEYQKDDIRDFVLWKGKKEGEPSWQAPFGEGRPGWHIECSAMSQKILGETIDIHTGGVDLIFPHHENEIAQSEAHSGKTFVRYWLHVEHLLVDNKKMSKSLGNLYTLNDLYEKGYTGREIRYLLISAHYRKKLNFTLEGLDAAKSAIKKMDHLLLRLREEKESKNAKKFSIKEKNQFLENFAEALDDDLNISESLGALYRWIHSINQTLEQSSDISSVSSIDAEEILGTLQRVDSVYGFIFPYDERLNETFEAEISEKDIEDLIQERTASKATKNFQRADEIREQLQSLGIQLEDTAQGTRWYRG